MLPIDSVPVVSYYVLYSNCVCKMRRFGDTRLLKLPLPFLIETRVRGHSRSSKLTPFDSLHYGFLLPSHSNFVSKMHHFRDMTTYWSKIAEKTQHTLIWHVPLRRPLANFSTTHTLQKLESWGYQTMYIS